MSSGHNQRDLGIFAFFQEKYQKSLKNNLFSLNIFFPGVEYDNVYETNKKLKLWKFILSEKKKNNQKLFKLMSQKPPYFMKLKVKIFQCLFSFSFIFCHGKTSFPTHSGKSRAFLLARTLDVWAKESPNSQKERPNSKMNMWLSPRPASKANIPVCMR